MENFSISIAPCEMDGLFRNSNRSIFQVPKVFSTSLLSIVEYLDVTKDELYLPHDLLLEEVEHLDLGRQTQRWET